MAKVIDESLKKQLSKKMVHFLKYFPVRIKNVGEDAVAARNLIWAFKDSRDDAYASRLLIWCSFVFRQAPKSRTKADTHVFVSE